MNRSKKRKQQSSTELLKIAKGGWIQKRKKFRPMNFQEGHLQGFEMIRGLILESEPFSVDNNLMTPTFKLKRHQLQVLFMTCSRQFRALKPSDAKCLLGSTERPTHTRFLPANCFAEVI